MKTGTRNSKTIGVISDAHGLVRPEALAALQGSDLIVHAGDIGSADVIEVLQTLAPVFAVRGNVDRDAWAKRLPKTQVVEVDGVFLYVLHDVNELDLDPVATNFHVVVSGHSHQPSVTLDRGILFLNPGSAGRRRFRLPVTVAISDFGLGSAIDAGQDSGFPILDCGGRHPPAIQNRSATSAVRRN